MWNTPTEEQLRKIPRLYETERVSLEDKVLHMHFFIGGCDWFIAEFDGDDIFFGYAILHDDLRNAEWGYVAFSELKSIKAKGYLEVDNDVHWKPQKASQVERMKYATFHRILEQTIGSC